MRELRTAVLCFLLVTLVPAPSRAETGCGCATPNRPCTEETLETLALPQAVPVGSVETSFDFAIHDTGTDLIGAFVVALLLLPIVLGVKRVARRRAALIVARLDLMSEARVSTTIQRSIAA